MPPNRSFVTQSPIACSLRPSSRSDRLPVRVGTALRYALVRSVVTGARRSRRFSTSRRSRKSSRRRRSAWSLVTTRHARSSGAAPFYLFGMERRRIANGDRAGSARARVGTAGAPRRPAARHQARVRARHLRDPPRVPVRSRVAVQRSRLHPAWISHGAPRRCAAQSGGGRRARARRARRGGFACGFPLQAPRPRRSRCRTMCGAGACCVAKCTTTTRRRSEASPDTLGCSARLRPSARSPASVLRGVRDEGTPRPPFTPSCSGSSQRRATCRAARVRSAGIRCCPLLRAVRGCRPSAFGHVGFTGTSLWIDPVTGSLLRPAHEPRRAAAARSSRCAPSGARFTTRSRVPDLVMTTSMLLDWFVIAGYFAFNLAIGLYYCAPRARQHDGVLPLGPRCAVVARRARRWSRRRSRPIRRSSSPGSSPRYGIAGNWLWWNMAASGMLTVFVYARLWRRAGVMTDVEFAELRYAGKPAAFLRGFRALYLGHPDQLHHHRLGQPRDDEDSRDDARARRTRARSSC